MVIFLFGRPIGPFFRFFAYMPRKCIFASSMTANFEKNQKNIRFYCRYLFFNFFFWIPITFTNFLGSLSSHCFDFLFEMAGKFHFALWMKPNFVKIKKCAFLQSILISHFFKSFFGFQLPFPWGNYLIYKGNGIRSRT